MTSGANSKSRFLDLTDTNILKGFALILLLIHHLFTFNFENWDDIVIRGHNYHFIQLVGALSNVCVALFVLLSGYGLSRQVSMKGVPPLKTFYRHRFAKLMFSYWFIFIIFVSIDIFIFDRNVIEVYEGNNVIIKFIADFFGLTHFFDFYGFNPTWWFMSMIILLYLLFPILYKIANKDPLLCLMLFSLVALISWKYDPATMFSLLLAFCLGIILARKPIECHPLLLIIIVLLLGIGIYLRRRNHSTFCYYDGIISAGIIYLYCITPIHHIIKEALSFVGKHSMNIFLFHTFIFYYWFRNFIYYFRNPLLILLVLLSSCLIISVVLEKMKLLIHFDKLIKKLVEH